ncbi:MAG: tRNA (adenosine(37)-N6)-threonylcarbamoyltransferase complex ATPase subunit type 1 TsaE [Clostridia bacterium]|nr:tRNA (adenosine(37)-N6)-threonylcarbamoyltransferase complex ATPase subunit type 1 TsaE [Clostridia bacterium]
MQIETISNSSEMTMQIAEKYAKTIKQPIVISLVGDLGAGKTTFAKGFAKGMGIEELVTSPTFTILNTYEQSPMPLYHFDMYRLSSKQEAEELGFEEYFDLKLLKGITLVEWAENVKGLLPQLHIEVKITKQSETERKISIGVRGWQ